MDIGNIKRNELDIIITDLLPVEISKMFTVNHFYKFLLTKNKDLEKAKNTLVKTKYSHGKLFKSWHATPLKYNVYKGNGQSRQISILNPFSLIQIYFFVSLYNDEILDQLSKHNHFSIRYHTKNNDLYFKYSKKGLVSYSTGERPKKYIEALQSSGIFYNIKPYKFLPRFYSDDYWFALNSKYKHFAKIDYKDCFGSIYTHTYKWIISNNTIDSRSLDNNHLYSVTDRVLQQINSSISNGIVVGPEFSRMIAEILLQQIDHEVYTNLELIGSRQSIDYNICRYVDDIFIFTNDESTLESVISLYREKSLKYQLSINDLKSKKGSLPHVWNIWKGDTKSYIDLFKKRFFYKEQEEKDYLIKGRNFSKTKHRSAIKEYFQNLLSYYPESADKIVSYVYSALFNSVTKRNKTTLFRKEITENEVKHILDVFIYIYSFAPTYRNTQKLISIIYLIGNEIGIDCCKNILQIIIKRYVFIFTKINLEDIVDLLMVLGLYKIEIPSHIESIIMNRIIKSDNPILAANFLKYSQYNKRFASEVNQLLEEVVKEKMSIITNSKNILLYDEFWWGIVFWECPYFNSQTDELIKRKISFLKSQDSLPNGIAKNLIYEFLNNKDYPNKFIKWDIAIENIMEDIAYFTYERTLFKGNMAMGESDYD